MFVLIYHKLYTLLLKAVTVVIIAIIYTSEDVFDGSDMSMIASSTHRSAMFPEINLCE